MRQPVPLHLLRNLLVLLICLVAIAAAINAWTYSYAVSIPLVQSDAWIFLDTYVRKYLEGNFGWRDFFLQQYSSDTNLPLHKLILLFHINHFHMDFKVEGLIGVASGMALVLLLAVAAAGTNPSRWRLPEFALLAWLALATLSLNSSNLYTWPLVTMWFLNLLIIAGYLVYMARSGSGPLGAFVSTLVLGMLLDEVALITTAAALVALAIQADGRPARARMIQAGAALGGLLLVRGMYWWLNAVHGIASEPVETPGLLAALVGLLSPEGLQTILFPLGDALVHQHVLEEWFPGRAVAVGYAIGAASALAHVWFWWRAAIGRDVLAPRAILTRRVAIALMLFFYGTLAGFALQRTPVFGIEYLHQPRYVIFYQLNLAALALMAYAEVDAGVLKARAGWVTGAMLLMALLGMGALQWQLSLRSWGQARYLSAYVEASARTIGILATNPGADIECTDILRVCDFPPAQRKELIYLLQNYQLNLFNREFQALYRLRPQASPADAAIAAPAAPDAPVSLPGDGSAASR